MYCIVVVMTFVVHASDNRRVLEAYNNCVSALTDFRSYHLQLVVK